tara:strand:+ start:2641 stop:3462 length:822 start_codon:yes stop_codon:yes gene_type:complete
MTDELAFFKFENPWYNDVAPADFIVRIARGTYVNDTSQWRDCFLCFDTSQHERKMSVASFRQVLALIPDQLSWKGDFVMGYRPVVDRLGTGSWKEALSEALSEALAGGSPERRWVFFVNLEARRLLKSGSDIRIERESGKKSVLLDLLRDSTILFRSRQGVTVLTTATSADPVRSLTVSCPPNKCDILIARSELVDAMPMRCLRQMASWIVHVGPPLKNKCASGALDGLDGLDGLDEVDGVVTLDSQLVGVSSFESWIDEFNQFVLDNLVARA